MKDEEDMCFTSKTSEALLHNENCCPLLSPAGHSDEV